MADKARTEATGVMDLRMVAVGDLIPTADNPRRRRDERALAELAASVEDVGVLEPVLARPHPTRKGKLDLRAGSRRLEASKRAKLSEIPVIVREMSDEEALRITVVENLQREDLTPFEESETVRLLQGKGWTLETISAQLGKSPAWVARRASLGNLSPEWQKAVLQEDEEPAELSLEEKRARVIEQMRQDAAADGEDVDDEPMSDEDVEEFYHSMFEWHPDMDAREALAEWPVGHLEEVARLPAELQGELLGHPWNGIPTLRRFRKVLGGHMRCLSGAPWPLEAGMMDVEKPDMWIPPCAECSSRSDRQPRLFEDVLEDGAPGHCLLPSCWAAKVAAFLKAKAEELIAEHGKGNVVFVRDRYDDKPPVDGTVVDGYSVERLEKRAKGAKACLAIGGLEAGQWYWGKVRSYGGSTTSAGPKGPTPLPERRDQLRRRRVAWIIKEVLLSALGEWERPAEPADVIPYVAVFGTSHRHDSPGFIYDREYNQNRRDPWPELERARADVAGAADALWESLETVLRGRLHYNGLQYVPAAEAAAIAGLLRLEWSALEAQAAEALPEPRGWAKLNEDGTPKGKASTAENGKASTAKAGRSKKKTAKKGKKNG